MFINSKKNVLGMGVVDVVWDAPDAVSMDWDTATFDGEVLSGISGTMYYGRGAEYVFAPTGLPNLPITLTTTPITEATLSVASLRDGAGYLPPGDTILPAGSTILNETVMAECEYTVTADTTNLLTLGYNKWLKPTKEMAEFLLAAKAVLFQWTKPATTANFLATVDFDIPEWTHESGFKSPNWWSYVVVRTVVMDSANSIIRDDTNYLIINEPASGQVNIDIDVDGLVNGENYSLITYIGTSQSMYDTLG